jgi:hypothetical protein
MIRLKLENAKMVIENYDRIFHVIYYHCPDE